MERSAVLIEHKSRLSVTCIIPKLQHVCPIGNTPHWCFVIYVFTHMCINTIYRVFFFHWPFPKKFKNGKPGLGESTLTQIGLDTPNLIDDLSNSSLTGKC